MDGKCSCCGSETKKAPKCVCGASRMVLEGGYMVCVKCGRRRSGKNPRIVE